MEGRVIKSTGNLYNVLAGDGKVVQCNLRGTFRIQGIKSTNPIAVGDWVEYSTEDGYVITGIKERRNYIIRKATKLSKQTQILASNLDQAALVVTVALPRTSTGFIDRFLVAAEAFHIPVIIVFNKSDLLDEALGELLDFYKNIYLKIGYKCISVSATTGQGLGELKMELINKTTLFCGHSGSGKSSLINKIEQGISQKTGDLSTVHFKGKHTTTFAEMFALKEGGFIVDTPGIKEFGLVDMDTLEISHRFPEILRYTNECKFSNCRHLEEPGCAVKKAVEKGMISEERYKNYLNIVLTED